MTDQPIALLETRSLADAHRQVSVPFRLQANKPGIGNVELIFHTLLRLLPGRRIVAIAECEGQTVLAKLFLGASAAKYAAREMAGAKAAASIDVGFPQLLWQGEIRQGNLLVFEYLSGSINLTASWHQDMNHTARSKLLSDVIKILAELHANGVVQRDIHLENFLLVADQLYMVDGGAIEQIKQQALPQKSSMENLALLFAQFYPVFDSLIDDAIACYESCRGWQAGTVNLQNFHLQVARSRAQRKRRLIAKTYRDCTRFHCQTSFSGFMVCEREAYTAGLAQLLADPEKAMAAGEFLKQGNSSTVALVNIDGRKLVIKRYNIKNVRHGLRRVFRKSRAWHAWANAHLLDLLGIQAMKPVAMMERRIGPLRKSAYLVTEYVEGIDAVACSKQQSNQWQQWIVDTLQLLSDNHVSHGDLKASNIVINDQGAWLIDLDSMQEHLDESRFKQAFSKDLKRFMDNWKDQPELVAQFMPMLEKLSSGYDPV